MEKVLVLGGTGFLGYYTVEELLKRGYEVVSVSLPPMPNKNMFSGKEVENILADLNSLTDQEVLEIFKGVDGLIYAIGADERTVPQAPAFNFFYEANVLMTQRIARLAAKADIKSFVVFGSYFAEFAERLYDLNLNEQPYPKTRILQEELAFAEGEGKMRVSSLRLPYIFGTMEGRKPLWTMFTDQIKGEEVFPAPSGGTAMVTVDQVAQAAVGALENGKHRHSYAISSLNMKHKDFYMMMVDAWGQDTQVPVRTYDEMKDHYIKMDKEAEDQGLEHGIHMEMSGWLSSIDLYLDPQETMPILGYKEDDVVASIRETLKECVKD